MDHFDKEKQDCLQKLDKSKKGSIDEGVKELLNIINNKPNFYTTSSCAGRIVLLVSQSMKKHEAKWLYVTHGEAVFDTVKSALENTDEVAVWLKQESIILHIACRTIQDAQLLVDLAKEAGLKRSGIMATARRFIVELINPDSLNTVVVNDGRVLISDDYLRVLLEACDSNMQRNEAKIAKLTEFCRLRL